jgi:hypothetical protein
MDVFLIPLSRTRLAEAEALIARRVYFSLERGGILKELDPKVVNDVVRQKIAKAKLLAVGFSHLQWFANLATTSSLYSAVITYDNVDLYLQNPTLFINTYADAVGIDAATAQKQVEFDFQNLQTLRLRRQEILWRYGKTLLEVNTEDELNVWRTQVKNNTVDVGVV